MVGIVQVILKSATDLARGGKSGLASLSDKRSVRCDLNLGRQKLKSTVIEGTENPRWNETIFLTWNGKANLYIDVFDGEADVGGLTVDLLQLKLVDGVPLDLTMTLEDTSSGSISFEVTLQKLGH